MATDRFLIGYTDNNSGLQTNFKPWLITDNAFAELENCYIYRGRVRKRLGSVWMSDTQLGTRLRYQVATTDGSGAASGTVPGTVFAVGQMFSVGTDIFTVNATGTPATLLSTNGSASMTYDTSTGDFTVTGESTTTAVYFYPATPVMGLYQYYVPSTNTYQNIAFDTQFSYKFDTVNNWWTALTAGTATWTGNDSQFFWGINYQGASPNLNYFWVSNNKAADGIRYFDGTTWFTPTLTYTSGQTISTALLIIQFKNRLLLLNTTETVSSTPTQFFNRVRYSGIADPLAANAWRQDIPGNGGFIDAPTQEAIVTAQFIKDRLIVYFESTTYELVYTGNQVQPFIWQKINTELGAESTFSEVPFDKEVLGVDNTGIHACNGSNVNRIDENIPQIAFNFQSVPTAQDRIVGIRDYYNELVYWTFPGAVRDNSFYFPNRILVYNYINNSWAFFDDSFTFFGYFPFEVDTPGATWGNTYNPWQEITMLWNSPADGTTTSKVKSVLAGNQEGFVSIMWANATSNAAMLQITDVTSISLGQVTLSIINHNLGYNDFITLNSMNGLTFTDSKGNTLTQVMARVAVDPYIANTPNSVTVTLIDNLLQPMTITGTYIGGGVAARASEISIQTKQYNFYTQLDRNIYLSKVDFLVDRTNIGEVTVDFLISSSQSSLLSGSITNGSLLGTNALETSPYALVPFENFQDRLWHPLYFYAEGECVQLSIFMSPPQMFDYVVDGFGGAEFVALQDFQLHAMIIYARPTTSRLQ